MGLRRWSIRARILLLVAIPILSLIGLYAFAATITARDAINLSRSRTLHDTIGTPTGNVEAQVDAERMLAVIYLAAPVAPNLAALHAQERKTEQAQAPFNVAVRSTATTSSAYPPEKQAIAAMLKDLAGLSALRTQVAAQTVTRARAISEYGAIIGDADAVLNQAILQESNVPLATQALALVRTGKSEEILLNEAALATGDILARSFSAADRQEFTQLAGARRAFYSQTLPDLEPQYRAIFARDISPQAMAALVALENKVIADLRPGRVPPVSIISWNAAVQEVSAGLSQAGTQVGEQLVIRAQPQANSTFTRLFLVGGLGLLAIMLSIFASIWIGRGLVRQLAELRRSALELASKRLPGVVAKLRAGQDVDVSAEAPPLDSGPDEIGQVTAAFNAVQETAVQAAVDEARLRHGVSDVFRNLARRSQSLLHRQLALLDTMERRTSEPEELEDLFRIDHLTTRMRRHSESLIILSGESPGRGWRHPVRLVDVLRAAVAEVEDYTRIRVTTGTPAALIGPAVADVIHLIAELAENATIFSPPNAPVRIHGDIVGRGFAVEIEDRGLGISEEKLARINHDLEHPPQFDLSGSEQLGLFVAGQLARRHDIKITLQPSPYGGITAIVLIPKDLIVDDTQAAAIAAGERAIRLTGRHGGMNQAAITEPPALAQLSAATSAPDPEPGPGAEPPAGPAAELPASPAAEPHSGQEAPAVAAAEPAADYPAADYPAADYPAAAARAVTLPQADSVFTPRRPQTAAADLGASFRLGGQGPQGYRSGAEAADPRVSTTELTEMGLPVRVRQASLAPQLRDRRAAAADSDEPTAGAPTPEAARSTMTALQRGWERGRYISGAPVPSFESTPGSQPSEDGDERADE